MHNRATALDVFNAGDFLLARASVSLARLRSIPVVELLSKVIEHLVKVRACDIPLALKSP